MGLREVVPGIYALEGLKMGRAYLVEDTGGLTLIDTSSPSASAGIFGAIAELGRAPDAVRAIVATHYHYDHTGNAGALIERTGATLYVHEDDVPYVDGRLPWPALDMPLLGGMSPEQFSLPVGRVLRDGDVVDAAGGLEVVHTPGHTPGHIALYARALGVVFSGDAFMNLAGLQLPPPASSHDMAQAKASIRRLSGLAFEHALPGHGQPVLSRASEKLGEWSRRWLETAPTRP